MRLITKRKEVIERLRRAGDACVPLLCPNAETPDEMEGVMLAASRLATARRTTIAIGLGFTASYPDHGQLAGIAFPGKIHEHGLTEAAQTWLGWLSTYAGRCGVFDDVEVIPFLDHGWAPNACDQALMRESWFQEALGIIMFDASARDFEENAALTAEYVQQAGAHVVVEACPDKVYSYTEIRTRQLSKSDMFSQPERVEEFVRRTGVDLLVPNLGTEHRSASPEPIEYQHRLASEIARRVGPIQALHGTSSLGGRLSRVGSDGICKINYYTGMARAASEAVRTIWSGVPGDTALSLSHACGSFLFRTRRDTIADNIFIVLETLHRREVD